MTAHKVGQKEFAAYVGVSLKTLEGWMHHKRIPNALYACKIAVALGVTVEYLVLGKKDRSMEKWLRETEKRKEAAKKIDKLIFHIALANSRLFGAAQLKYTAVKGIPSFHANS